MGCNSANRLPLPGSLSSCAIDESIVPLPSIFLLIFALGYIAYTTINLRRRQSTSSGTNKSFFSYTSPGLPEDTGARSRIVSDESQYVLYGPPIVSSGKYGPAFWTRIEKIVHFTYLGLVGCLLGMRVVEIARLDAAKMGVGLLPFGIIISVFLVFAISTGDALGMGRTRGIIFSSALFMYWAFSLIMESVKVARLVTYNALYPAKDTRYPSSDWLLDNAVILGLIVVFYFVEGAYLTSLVRHTFIVLDGVKSPHITTTEFGEARQASDALYNPPIDPSNQSNYPYNYRLNVGHARNVSDSTFSLSSQSHHFHSHSFVGQSQRGSQTLPGSPRSWTFGGRSSPRIDKSTISKPVSLTSNSIGF